MGFPVHHIRRGETKPFVHDIAVLFCRCFIMTGVEVYTITHHQCRGIGGVGMIDNGIAGGGEGLHDESGVGAVSGGCRDGGAVLAPGGADRIDEKTLFSRIQVAF